MWECVNYNYIYIIYIYRLNIAWCKLYRVCRCCEQYKFFFLPEHSVNMVLFKSLAVLERTQSGLDV